MVDPSAAVPSRAVVAARQHDGEIFLLHLESGQYHELNVIGSLIWDLLDGSRGASEIAVEIRRQVEDPPGDLAEIVAEFLVELRQRGLII